jgi:hypothetical protein
MHGGGPLSHKKGGLIRQFDIWLGCDIKIDYYIIIIKMINHNDIRAHKRQLINVWALMQCSKPTDYTTW